MNMSNACLPPVQPQATEQQRQHPRFAEYAAYRSRLARQLVTAASFTSWLRQTEEYENGRMVIFQVTSNAALLAPGWYCNVFLPRQIEPETYGPFATRAEAEEC